MGDMGMKVGDLVRAKEGVRQGEEFGLGVIMEIDARFSPEWDVKVLWSDSRLTFWYRSDELEAADESR